MISWIQRTFQQHFKAVFGLLLAVTIISFIITIGATPGLGGARARVTKESFFGRNLASQAEVASIDSQAELSIELRLGYNPSADPDQIRQYALERVAALHVADELHLPTPSPDSELVKDYIEHLRMFAGPDGQFDAQRYAEFQANLATSQVSDADVARVLVDDVRIQQVRNLLAGPGYILPADVTNELIREDTKWTIATADVDYASFHPAVPVTDALLQKYYQDNAFRFQVAPRVSAGYVDFSAAAYLPGVQVTDAEVRAYYDQDPARFPAPVPAHAAKPVAPVVAKPAAASADADFAAVRPQVEAALKFERAKALAVKAASDFAFNLYQNNVASGAPLQAYLAAHHIIETPLAPFTQAAGPAELGRSKQLADAAFQLNSERYYSDALPTAGGAVVLLWKANLPAYQPPFVQVKGQVQAAYLDSERRRLFSELGYKLKAQIASGMKSGEDFAKAAAAAAAADAVRETTKTWPPFTLQDRPPALSPTALATLDRLKRGEVSDMAVADNHGYLVYVAAQQLPDLSPSSADYATMRGELASFFGQRTAGDYLSQLTDNELAKAKSAIP